MVQFSRPKKSLAAAMDPFKRRETSAAEFLSKSEFFFCFPTGRHTKNESLADVGHGHGQGQSSATSRFDPAYYRTHNPLSFIPPDAQSVVSQALTSSAFPLFGGGGGVGGGIGGGAGGGGVGGKNKTYTGYASSVISQQPIDGGNAHGHDHLPPRVAGQSQFDRFANVGGDNMMGMGMGMGKGRRLSIGSEAASASMYAYGYKAGEDDTQSIAPSQAGMTEF